MRFAVVTDYKPTFIASTATVFSYDDASCSNQKYWMYLIDGALARPDHRKLGMPLWNFNDNAAKEFYVTADKNYYFMIATNVYAGTVAGRSKSITCATPVFTRFAAGHDYELLFRMMDSKTCVVVMNEIVSTSGEPSRQPLQVFENLIRPISGCARAFDRLFR